MPAAGHLHRLPPFWECRECFWLFSPAHVGSIHSQSFPCPIFGRSSLSFRPLNTPWPPPQPGP
jgi:hypothetical protein